MLNLTNLFYDLVENGWIYEEDENGLAMSYGEYMAVTDYAWNLIREELEPITDKVQFLETAKEIFDSADDDAAMFFGLEEDDQYLYIEEDEPDKTMMSLNLRSIYNDVDFNEYAA